MRIFLFLLLSLSIWGCTTVEVTKEVIKVTNTITDQVKEIVPKNETEEQEDIDKILEEKEIEEEIEIIEETQEEEKNIVASQQKLAEINFIGKTENQIQNLLGEAQLSRIDGPFIQCVITVIIAGSSFFLIKILEIKGSSTSS